MKCIQYDLVIADRGSVTEDLIILVGEIYIKIYFLSSFPSSFLFFWATLGEKTPQQQATLLWSNMPPEYI